MLKAKEHRFEADQFLPRPIDEVFAFFSSEKNLEQITPPWLGFRVLGSSTPEIQQGTLIDYRLSLFGVPMRWRTLIERWEPGRCFVDRQLKGPYALWHHTHTFTSVEGGGTQMHDVVRYQLPLGLLGDLSAHWLVRQQVRAIFAYRRKVITRLFQG